jgi:hypothetical protein
MPMEAPNAPGFCRESWRAWIGRDAEDVPAGWMDDMVKRLLEQQNRRLIKLEDKKNDELEAGDPRLCEQNSRILSRITRDVMKLVQFETARAALRQLEVASKHEGALEELIRRVDRVAAARGLARPPEDAE